MDHPGATVRRAIRLVIAASLVAASMSALAPAASARDSTVRITLTLRGHVPDDVGFSLAAGGILAGAFCEFEAIRKEQEADNPGGPLAPLCRRDVTYTMTLTTGRGERLDYSISKFWLRDAHTLWSGTVTGDGRDHTRTYVYLFDLPATDTLPPQPRPVPRFGRQPL